MEVKFRDYQDGAIESAVNYINSSSKRPSIIVAPTAAGKSWIIAGIADRYSEPILVLQPSVELLKQNYEKYELMGGNASIFSASISKDIGHVTYATLGSVKKFARKFRELGVKLVLIDECHFKYSPEPRSMFRTFMEELKPKKVIGFTATPFRLKSNMEGSRLVMLNRMRPGYFKDFLHITQVSEVIEKGFWTPSKDEVWKMDESGLVLNSTGSEFTEESVKTYVETNGINNKIYLRILDAIKAGRKHILVFPDSVDSCRTFVKHLRKVNGVTCDWLEAYTPKNQRKELVEKFKSGEIQVVFNYGILTTGFDFPELDTIIMGRPTNSLAVFYQIYGRGSRISDGKEDFLFIDFGNNFQRLAHPRDIIFKNVLGHGWATFCGDRLVSGVTLGMPPITEKDITEGVKDEVHDVFFKFGKYAGQKAVNVAKSNPSYITWFCENVDTHHTFKSKLLAALHYTQVKELVG
jgi:DNA repair protein RadD